QPDPSRRPPRGPDRRRRLDRRRLAGARAAHPRRRGRAGRPAARRPRRGAARAPALGEGEPGDVRGSPRLLPAAGRGGAGVTGVVSLVGAGPGDPGLITVRGLDLLRACDAVVYDRLVAPELVDEAPAGALRISRELLDQEEINDLLVDLGRQGLAVVRLKGGDPFVFGRGGEEALALADAGLPFEVVPGISSLAAVPAAAGIPVTHRGLSQTVTLSTAHGED